MKNLVIFGPNDFGRLLKYYINIDDSRKVVAFTANKEFINNNKFCDLDVVPFEEIEKNYPSSDYEILIAIGNSKMNDVRKSIFQLCKNKGYSVASYIHSSCSIHTDKIGEGNIMLEKCLLYPFSEIGDGNLLWDHVLISHDCKVGSFNTFSSYADLCGYVIIGDNSYFGKHCILNEHTKIANYTLIGAGAYNKKDTKQYDVVVPTKSYVLENKKSTDLM